MRLPICPKVIAGRGKSSGKGGMLSIGAWLGLTDAKWSPSSTWAPRGQGLEAEAQISTVEELSTAEAKGARCIESSVPWSSGRREVQQDIFLPWRSFMHGLSVNRESVGMW